jgi:hypothetical protein
LKEEVYTWLKIAPVSEFLGALQLEGLLKVPPKLAALNIAKLIEQLRMLPVVEMAQQIPDPLIPLKQEHRTGNESIKVR